MARGIVTSLLALELAFNLSLRLPEALNITGVDAQPILSFGGTELYIHSSRTETLGGNDILLCTRTTTTGRFKK
jgi:hypothetical protein